MSVKFEQQIEDDFRHMCDSMAYYQGDVEEVTIDHEWTRQDLEEDVLDMVHKVLSGDKKTGMPGWLEKNQFRAVKDPDLLKDEYLANYIIEQWDMIEAYNKRYDKHRNDKPMKFGICYFDDEIVDTAQNILKKNLVSN